MLKNIHVDRTAEIRSCVNQLRVESADAAKRAAHLNFNREKVALIAQIKNTLSGQGVDPSTLGLDDFLPRGFSGLLPSMQGPVWAQGLKRTSCTSLPLHPTKEQRKGTCTITGRSDYNKMSVTEKLAFIASKADVNTGQYKNSDRQWLLRINPIARCYTVCCCSDPAVFFGKHGKQLSIATLTANKLSGCDNCGPQALSFSKV